MPRMIPHQITLVAYQRDAEGSVSIVDICETSHRCASYFARRFMKDPTIHGFAAVKPRAHWDNSAIRWKDGHEPDWEGMRAAHIAALTECDPIAGHRMDAADAALFEAARLAGCRGA